MIDLDLDQYFAALDFATAAHAGQTRKGTGESYITHPMRVAQILSIGDNNNLVQPHMLVAALLHDAVEDTEITQDDIYREFGYAAAVLVEALTRQPGETKDLYMWRAISHSVEAALIKLADRLDNLRDARCVFSPEKYRSYRAQASSMVSWASSEWGVQLTTTDVYMALQDQLAKDG